MKDRYFIIRAIEQAARRQGRMSQSQLFEIEAQKRLIRAEAKGGEAATEGESAIPQGDAQ